MNYSLKKLTVLFLLLTSTVFFSSCNKNNEQVDRNKTIFQTDLTKKTSSEKNYKTLLISLNIKFWTRLASQPISEIKKVCDERNADKLISLAGFSSEELKTYMDKTIYYASEIEKVEEKSDCHCTDKSDMNFNEIYQFVLKIKNGGGADAFFKPFLHLNNQNLQYSSVGGADRVAACLASCSLTCLPLGLDPPAWATCGCMYSSLLLYY